ncbi:MAG: class I SAM-dependent methyltransferase [Chthoniobacterales bacterium]
MSSSVSKLPQFFGRISKIALRKPTDLRFVFGHANYAAGLIDDPIADVRDIPEINFAELGRRNGGSTRFEIQCFPGIPASISPLEANVIALLVRSTQAKVAFEFGTYKGVSTTQIALNLVPNGIVHTIDLPEENSSVSLSISDAYERKLTLERGKGVEIPTDLLDRVQFHKIDSAHFDETPFLGKADFVFIDGAHSFDYVASDSAKGMRLLRPGGIAVWHDCMPTHPDVVRYIRSIEDCAPTRITGTALAYAEKPA